MKKEDRQRFTLRISQANSTELVVILYEMLLCYLEDAVDALQAEETEDFKSAVRKARGCLNELMDNSKEHILNVWNGFTELHHGLHGATSEDISCFCFF